MSTDLVRTLILRAPIQSPPAINCADNQMPAQSPLLCYDVHGQGGPHLLLVHGFLSSRAHWLLNLEALSTRFRPVVIELLGHARSPTPNDPSKYSPDAYVAEF